jgi:hypothetical protein
MADFTTSNLISSVKRKALLPTGMISDTDIIELMDDELHTAIIPFLMRLREDYFATWVDFTTGGTNIFEIPTDAIGAKLKDVVFYLSGYQEAFVNVARLTIEELSANRYDSMRPYGFYILGNKLYFYPQNAAAGQTLRLYYYKRINHLTPILDTVSGVEVNYACKITDITNNIATVDIIPDGWTTTTAIDVIKGIQNYDVTSTNSITDITGNVITLANTGPSIGDYLCVRGDTVYPQIPEEIHPLLVQATIIKVLESMKDDKGLKIAAERYAKMEDDLMTLLTPRVDGEPKKIVNAGGIFDFNKISTRRPWG